jgi:Bacteriophage minor capsid protein
MAFLDDIKTRIDSLAIAGYVCKTASMGSTPDLLIVVYEYGGNPPEFGFGTPGLKYAHPGLNVKVRGVADDYAGPRAVAQLVWLDLPKVQVTTLGGTAVQLIKPTGSVTLFERDGNKRCVFNMNFIVDHTV